MSEEEVTSPTDFSDERIADLIAGRDAMTAPEREFLCIYTAAFEECQRRMVRMGLIPRTASGYRALFVRSRASR